MLNTRKEPNTQMLMPSHVFINSKNNLGRHKTKEGIHTHNHNNKLLGQMDLETLKNLTEYLDSYTYPKDFNLEQRAKLRRQTLLYFLRDGRLFRKNRKNQEQPL